MWNCYIYCCCCKIKRLRWDKLQERGEPPGRVVQWQQSLSECGEDEGDCRWLQESAHSACSSDHQWCDRGESEQHQVPGCTHHRGPLLDNNTAALAKKAQQRLYFLRKLRRARAPAPIMCTFYRGTIESILTSCITVWYGACNASCRKSLQRIVRAAEKIVGVSLPSLQDIYNTRLTRKALSIAGDPPTRHTTSSVCFHQRGDWRVSKPGQTDWKTASSTRLSGSWTPSRPCPPSPLLPHESLNSDPHPTPPPPPTRTHTHTHTHSHSHWDKHRSLVQHWTDLIHSTTSSGSLNKKDCSLSL